MTDNLQTLNSIGPAEQDKQKKPADPVEADYEEGKRYLENQSYGQAAVALHNALVGYKERNDESGIANASNQLGHLCLARKEYDRALDHYQQALEICDKANDRMSVLAVSQKIVEVHKALNQYRQGIDVCLEMLDHYHDNRDPQGTVTTLEEIADFYVLLERKDKAADTCRTIASIHKNFRHETIAAAFMEKAAKLEGGG